MKSTPSNPIGNPRRASGWLHLVHGATKALTAVMAILLVATFSGCEGPETYTPIPADAYSPRPSGTLAAGDVLRVAGVALSTYGAGHSLNAFHKRYGTTLKAYTHSGYQSARDIVAQKLGRRTGAGIAAQYGFHTDEISGIHQSLLSAKKMGQEASLTVRGPEGVREIPNDFGLAMTGYQPDFSFLERLGITLAEDGCRTPVFDPATFESARPGVYVAGTVCGGLNTGRWFIENGRFHARQIVAHLTGGRAPAVTAPRGHWKTEE